MLSLLFRAYFSDGTVFEQTQEDRAVLDIEHESGSAFTDLLYLQQREKRQLVVFVLCLPTGEGIAAVDLTDGHFELCGSGFWAGDEALGEGVKRSLIYYRTVTRERTQEVDAQTLEALSDWTERERVRYHIGWQATVKRRRIKHIIGVDEAHSK